MREDGMMRKRKISLDDDEESSNIRRDPTSFRKNANTRYGLRRRAIAFLFALCLLGFVYYNYADRFTLSADDDDDEVSLNLKKHKNLEERKGDEDFENKFLKIPRYLSFVRLDKPVYVVGDTVRARVVVLNEKTFMPYTTPKRGGGKKDRRPFQPPLSCEMKIYGPKEDEIETLRSERPKDATLAISWNSPPDLAGGTYRAVVRCESVAGHPAAERSFEMRTAGSTPPKMNLQLNFDRKAYGSHDMVVATLTARRLSGDASHGASVQVTARVMGDIVEQNEYTISSKGTSRIQFELGEITSSEAEGTLTCVVRDAGTMQSISKTIPIVAPARDLIVDVYPESGAGLVKNVENRIYIEVSSHRGEPADVEAEIVQSDTFGRRVVVGTIRTTHEGRGRSTFFVPDPTRSYALEISKTNQHIPLSFVDKYYGVLVSSSKDVYEADDDAIEVRVKSSYVRTLTVSLFHRERLVDSKTCKSSPCDVKFTAASNVFGTLRVTVFGAVESEDKFVTLPVAERLIFRRPHGRLDVQVMGRVVYEDDDKDMPFQKHTLKASPGDMIELRFQTSLKGERVDSILGASVVDDAVLESVDKRRKHPSLSVMALFENEIESPVIFDPDTFERSLTGRADAEADEAVDLLLGTQGWRRFAYENANEWVEAKDEDQRERDARERVFAVHPMKIVPRMRMFKNARAEPVMYMMADMMAEPVMMAEPLMMAGAVNEEPPFMELENAPLPEADFEENVFVMPEFELPFPPPSPPRESPLVSRIYAHSQRKFTRHEIESGPLIRSDFTETVFWSASMRSGETGKFALSDSLTSFRVLGDAFSQGFFGGTESFTIVSEMPLQVDVTTPAHLIKGDRMLVPVTITSKEKGEFDVKLQDSSKHSLRLELEDDTFKRKFQGSTRMYVPMTVRENEGVQSTSSSTNITVYAHSLHHQDAIRREIYLKYPGFPVTLSHGGLLARPDEGELRGSRKAYEPFTFTLPSDIDLKSLQVDVTAYPTPVGSLTEAISSLIREPCGCFEQTSATTYPLIMALMYLKSHRDGSEKVEKMIASAEEKLRKGYKKLISYESANGGFEWFGASPAHEALTAYGLAQFRDLDVALPGLVDSTMMKRTKNWLLGRRDGNGGFKRNPKSLDSFGSASAEITDSYITWAMFSGSDMLDLELKKLENVATESEDAYIVALASLALYELRDSQDKARSFARTLSVHQNQDGSVSRVTETITRSGGESKILEATALAALAWMRQEEDFADHVRRAMEWIVTRCKGGKFGSTQSTVLALRAIVEYDKLRMGDEDDVGGQIRLKFDDRTIESLRFAKDHDDDTEDGVLRFDTTRVVRDLVDRSGDPSSSSHLLELELVEGKRSGIPFSMTLRFNAVTPRTDERCDITMSTSWTSSTSSLARVLEGDVLAMNVRIENVARDEETGKPKSVPMVIARVGIPAGLEPRVAKLRELKESGVISFFEIRHGELIFYWRGMAPSSAISFDFDLVATVPGRYQGGSSSAYLYYTSEYKRWSVGLEVEVVEDN